jgi:hypothetical protein
MFLPALLPIMPGLARLIHPFRRDLPNVQRPAEKPDEEIARLGSGKGRMKRREFVGLLGGAVATVILARASRAQPVKMPRVRSMN